MKPNEVRANIEARLSMVIDGVDRGLVIPKVGLEVAMLAVNEFERDSRLDEAEWWEHLVGAQHQIEGIEDCESDCIYCQRIAELRDRRAPYAGKESK